MNKMLITTNKVGLVALSDIPVLEYSDFFEQVIELLKQESCHILSYFAREINDGQLEAIILIGDDSLSQVHIASYRCTTSKALESIANVYSGAQAFEREINENFGLDFMRHPYAKPLRYSAERVQKWQNINNYPFYSIAGDSLHEVNVGPIHAGIIEPGVFRFICNGEKVLNLEIVLGYQHRGIERLITQSANTLKGALLAESIAGDSVVSHASTYAAVIENLSDINEQQISTVRHERAIAQELERIAMHLSDTAGLSTDIAYQLGQVSCEALRTIIINTSQAWCGNRFSKAMIRPCGSNFPLTDSIRKIITDNVKDVQHRYKQVADNLQSMPSVLSRFEDCGHISRNTMLELGAVGVVARASGLARDIRSSHPFGAYIANSYTPIIHEDGDVMSRLKVRLDEGDASANYILELLDKNLEPSNLEPEYAGSLKANALAFNLNEGWRGEICHTAITDSKGNISHYKIVDPSFHNWYALGLTLREEGISDFPINNKSFNLSYCGHDL
ncbi:MAG: NADH-quinone oxidoreductase subunit C [Rikenellaceae bacterium]